MGEVYRARDTRLERTVAIKILPPDLAADPDRLARFEREARTIASLNHPHICTLHDIGQHDGATFLVMEHIEGQTLAERLLNGPLPLEQALTVATAIADALSAAHRHEVNAVNFAPRSTVPTLMVNGRSDMLFPLETSQVPMFRLLGTPDRDKRHLVIEAGHVAFNQDVVREVLSWLDRYLGPVKTR
jgi:pimeloyl-ACP methyl ester carboxylesterase